MRSFLVLCLLSGAALAGPPRDEPRSARMARPTARPEPAAVTPDEMALVPVSDGQSVDAAGAVGMLTALAASFVFARSRRSR